MDSKFTHLDSNANPNMVDVGSKTTSRRTAKAQVIVTLGKEIMELIENDEIIGKKGPIFQTAILAGIMAAKKTSDLIPLCHPLGLDNCELNIHTINNTEIKILCSASLESKTGVEMEALTGASVAALTVYDMCKALSHEIVIKELKLIEKTGGKKDFVRNS